MTQEEADKIHSQLKKIIADDYKLKEHQTLFIVKYTEILIKRIRDYPQSYGYSFLEVPKVISQIIRELNESQFNCDSFSMRTAAKYFGLYPVTRKKIVNYWKGIEDK